MGFFSRLEQTDRVINRIYARWGKWIWGALLAPIVLYYGYVVWGAVWGPPTGGVTLIIHSEIDRPILGFSVNGVHGGNAFAHGGGKSACCGNISGNEAEVIWTLSTTRAQYDAGLRMEKRKVVMPLPKREWGEDYLHVYFLPGDNVRLWWGDGFLHPKASELPEPTKGKL